MLKSDIRDKQLQWRRSLSNEEVDRRSQQVAHTFLSNIPLKGKEYCHLFLPITRSNELNTYVLIHLLWREYPDITIVVSKSNFSDCSMQQYILRPETVLSMNSYGIPEPADTDELVDEKTLDLVVFPLLAVDSKGNRVGYGKGFYDRMLLQCSPTVKKIGIGFHEQLLEKITDTKPHDVKLDAFVSEDNYFSFRNKYSK